MLKIKESFSQLLDESKPLIPQLRGIKRSCFKPYISDLQLIRYNCEDCAANNKYSSCKFYEASHLSCFEKYLTEIQNNNSIQKPKYFHPKTERLCHGRNNLEKILKASWELYKHNLKEPTWVDAPESKEWSKDHKELQKKLPCESTCKMAPYCAFYQNSINFKLTVTDIVQYDDEEIYYDTKTLRKFDKGYVTKSFLYKNFITPTKVKELAPVKTDFGFKKLDEWQYKVYEKVFNATQGQKKQSVVSLKGVIDVLINEKEESVFLEKLKESNSFDFKKTRGFLQKHSDDLTETAHQLIDINLTFWAEWVKCSHLEFADVLYSFYLTQEKTPSRKDIEDKFGISRHTQVEMERRLGIRKDFRGKGNTQFTNKYLTNPYIMGAIFKTLNREETKEKLTELTKHNKEKLKREKLYNRKGNPKINNNLIEKLNQIYQGKE